MRKVISVEEVTIEIIIDTVKNGDEIVLEENGKPIAKIIPIQKSEKDLLKHSVLDLGREETGMSKNFNVKFVRNKVRVYELAKELKKDTKLIMEELRREGADISAPSNSVSRGLAEKIWTKYSRFSTEEKRQIESSSTYSENQTRDSNHIVENNKPNNLKNSIDTEKLPWKIFSEKEWRFDKLVKHFNNLNTKKNWQKKKFEERRLMRIEQNLNPKICYVGEEEFEGYIVYCFDRTDKVVLESPFYGNATYIINGNWQEIAKGSKWRARYSHTEQVKVIRHSKKWFENLKTILKT